MAGYFLVNSKMFKAKFCLGLTKFGRPPNDFVFDAQMLSENEFNDLFENVVEIAMCIEVRNTMFRRIRFPKLQRWYSCNAGPALTVIGNPELTSIEFNKNVQFLNSHPNTQQPYMAIIRGNRNLLPESIQEIAAVFQSYRFIVPTEGECSSPGYVRDLAQLNCDAYYGDIVFGQNPIGDIPSSAGDVEGCVIIKDTLLTDIEFLRNFRFKTRDGCRNLIIGNKYLCISEELERHLRRHLDITIANNMHISCRELPPPGSHVPSLFESLTGEGTNLSCQSETRPTWLESRSNMMLEATVVIC
ncbi:hypothetical protein Y032_0583g300 [Ancylostoma ceylanicum]|uniref:Receptor L-domain domain-containing protein n=1 Tax=Ancylostoma ceylanicum TaxID=53326 RepID=A0A016WQ04_9BILA|nr:hypothetical protein Y032_0583g300 [Ancylostoma ceylanicum]